MMDLSRMIISGVVIATLSALVTLGLGLAGCCFLH
jgi:hypothetical protein